MKNRLIVILSILASGHAEDSDGQIQFLCHKSCHCPSETTAICEDSALDSLEAVQFEPVLEDLTLTGNNFIELQPGFFNSLVHIVQIQIESNPISSIRPLTFHSLDKLESVSIENNDHLAFIDQSAFNNLTSLETITLKNNPKLFYIDPLAFVGIDNLSVLDLSGSAITALDTRQFPADKFFGEQIQFDCQSCLNQNNIHCSESLFDQCDADLAYAAIKNFEFTFDIHTVNIARCFFLGGNIENHAAIVAGDIVMSENGVWEPVTVTRKLEGEYRCTKGTESHAVYINVFPSEDVIFDSWEDMSMNGTVDGKLTLGIADFDLSADVFSDPELYFQNGTETTDEMTTLANPGDSNAIDMSGDMSGEGSGEGSGSNTDDIDIGSAGTGWNWNWISLTIVLFIAILVVLLLIIMPRIGLYTVLFNLQHVPPKQTV